MSALNAFREKFNTRPIVVAALQSPHMLNIWQQSEKWRLYYDLLGDHEGLEESRDLEVGRFNPLHVKAQRVAAALVASPLQMETAKKKFPNAKIFWVVHTGYFLEVFPSEHLDKVDGIVTLTKSVLNIQMDHKPGLGDKKNFIITPYYETQPTWRWKENLLWTVRSRAGTRMAPSKDRFEYVMNGVKSRVKGTETKVLFFGQDSPDGYLDKTGKLRLFENSSAYISALPENAGFGLAEHEALSHGVPIVGSRWGDIDTEVSPEYKALTPSQDEMIDYAVRLANDKEFAEEMSELGLEYIRKYRNKKSMDRQITKLVSFLRKN